MICTHPDTEPVALYHGETVARTCTRCHAWLPVNHGCPDCEWTEIRTLGGLERVICTRPCQQHEEDA